ncbi:hypothetical protein JCM16303_005071 [Sporobolomyces ruberrimus]
MASSSPPPPPDPNRNGNNPFDKSHYREKVVRRPSNSLRRAKTLSNPEGETTWRRDPLLDITNSYLERDRTPRLQRVAYGDLPPRARDDLALTPSPSPSRRPLNGGTPLRRNRSEAPSHLVPINFDQSSPPVPALPLPFLATPARPPPSSPFVDPIVPLSGSTEAQTPTRELRPRTRSSTSGATSPAPPSSASSSSPAPPPTLGARRTRTRSISNNEEYSTTATPPSVSSSNRRRRTFGGLSALPEELASESGEGSESTGGSRAGEGGGSSENEQGRRLRRRRTSASESTGNNQNQNQARKPVLTRRRSGLR